MKRVLQAIPLLFVISFIVFSLIHIAPYDVIDSITTPNMTQEQIDLLRQRYGLDQPFLVQYFLWIKNILTGNLGFSLVSQNSIAQELAVRIPNTIRLVLPAYLTALLLAILLGLLAAANKGKVWDRLIDGIASLGIAVSAESVSYHWDVYCWKRRRFQRFSATFYFALCNTDGRFFPRINSVHSRLSYATSIRRLCRCTAGISRYEMADF